MNLFENLQTFKEIEESKKLAETSYGGAYDILDDQYFTRDDLNDFAGEVLEDLSKMSYNTMNADLVEIYLEDNNVLEMTITCNDIDYTSREKIDMRKIKTFNHLIKMYANDFASDFYNQIQVDELERENESIDRVSLKEHDYKSITDYWVYKEIKSHGYQIEFDDDSVIIKFPKPDNTIYAAYSFEYDSDCDGWTIKDTTGIITDEFEDTSSYESVVRGCLYNFWSKY